ncbi:MAG TPA: P-loop NTPase fold protein [Pseudolysinimonas sp.]|nr:P-loop NTPase fold protein [Pseudolysinimonas sp.]
MAKSTPPVVPTPPTESPLTIEDLVRDEPLDKIAGSTSIPDELDLLNHRSTARRVAQLAGTAERQLNIAVFGPWGSGKSSFFGLLEQELGRLAKPLTPVRFDAWQNAGAGFRENFLAEISSELGFPGMDERLFAVKRSIKLPFISTGDAKKRRGIIAAAVVIAVGVVVGLPLLQTSLTGPPDDFFPRFWPIWIGWISFGAGSSVIYLVLSTLANISKVDVEEAQPSFVSQFRSLFNELLDQRPGERFAILIDELDRCAPKDVMTTLEGLRTFLGHERCVFVVAFDRAAIAEAVSAETPNKVPLQEGGAYYATAGEYLDKIFQYQVSLPPQPHHGPRRYALSLVANKRGVWGSLNDRSPEFLRRVVQLLSPIHLTSPRRTKVLLNDFAINMRLYESMGFEWIDRAEEIAAWTVIQTEFPGVANAMEQDTRTLGRIASGLREADLAAGGSGEPADSAAPDELDDLEADVLVGDPNAQKVERKAIGDELRDEVRTYVRRLLELNVTLPRADLILMHADGGLLKFDDPEIYNLLQDPAGVSRGEAVALLSAANVADRVQAVTYLLEQLETELPGDERSSVLVLIGEIAEMLSVTELDALKYALRSTWTGLDAERAKVAESSTAARGFLRSFVGEAKEVLAAAFDGWGSDRSATKASVVERINADSVDIDFLAYSDLLLTTAALDSLDHPQTMSELLKRTDRLGDPVFASFPNALHATFTIAEPESVTATTRRGVAVADAAGAEQAVADYEALSDRARLAFGQLLSGPYRDSGSVRRALRRVLVDLYGRDGWPLDLHDELVLGAASSTHVELRTSEILEAIAARPEEAAARWVPRLVSEQEVDSLKLQQALEAVIQLGSSSTDDVAQTNAVLNARAMTGLKPKSVLSIRGLVDAAQPLAAVADWTSTRVQSAFELLNVVASLVGEDSAIEELQLSVALVAYDGAADATAQDSLLAAVAALPGSLRRRLAEELDWSSNDFATSVVVRCQAGLKSDTTGLVSAPSVVARYPADPAIVGAWLESGPSFAEVERVRSSLPSAVFTSDLLKGWASAVDEVQRVLMWRELLGEDDSDRALAAAGEQLPDDAVDPELTLVRTATSAPQREEALRPLLAAPPTSRVYRRAVVAVAPVLASAGAQQDLNTLATLLERGPSVSPQERSRIRALLEGMVSKNPNTLSRQRISNLVDLQFLNKRGIGAVWDRVFGTRSK